jgi:sugar lactone lactonase YvrE
MRSTLVLLLALLVVPSARAERIVLVAGGADAATKLHEPFGVDFDRAGSLFIVEMEKGNRLLRLDARGTLVHVAGQMAAGDAGDGTTAPLAAQFRGPHNLAVLPDGRIALADTWNGRVRTVAPASGNVASLAGYGVPADKARANGPYCITLTPDGTRLLIADLRRVHALELATGRLTVLAGNGEKGVPRDGARATESPLSDPRAAAMDRKGNLYILERNGHALRVVAPDGTIRTVVNASGKKGAGGDGGDALAATMNGPKHLCVDRDGTVLIADAENHLIRRYVPATGKILRVAGTGKRGTTGLGGPPKQAELARPHGVSIAPDGTLYITDSYNDRILKIVK